MKADCYFCSSGVGMWVGFDTESCHTNCPKFSLNLRNYVFAFKLQFLPHSKLIAVHFTELREELSWGCQASHSTFWKTRRRWGLEKHIQLHSSPSFTLESRPTSTPVGSACVFVYCLVSGKCQLVPRHTLGSVCLLHTAGQESRFSKWLFCWD